MKRILSVASLLSMALYVLAASSGGPPAPFPDHHVAPSPVHSEASPADWKEVWRSNVLLTDPYFLHVHDGEILVGDFRADVPLQVLGDDDGQMRREIGALGQGPGEIQALGGLFQIDDNHVALTDLQTQGISIFEIDTGQFVHRINDRRISFGAALGNDLVVVRPLLQQNAVLARGYTFATDDGRRFEIGNELWSIDLAQIEEFAPAEENPLLKFGTTVIDAETVYLGFDSSSRIVAASIDTGEVLFSTNNPDEIELPEYVGASDQATMRAPPRDRYPIATIGMAVDNQHLYVLHSGKRWTEHGGMDATNETRTLHVYNKRTGNHLQTLELPYATRDIVVSESHVYLITIENEPAVVKLEKPTEIK
jgi:hypothetical protein